VLLAALPAIVSGPVPEEKTSSTSAPTLSPSPALPSFATLSRDTLIAATAK